MDGTDGARDLFSLVNFPAKSHRWGPISDLLDECANAEPCGTRHLWPSVSSVDTIIVGHYPCAAGCRS